MKTKIPFIILSFMLCAISKAAFAQPGSCFGTEVWSCFYAPTGENICTCVDSSSAPAQQCAGGQVLACRLDQHCDWECQCMDSASVSTWQSHGHNCNNGGGGGGGNGGGHGWWYHHWHGHYRTGENQLNLDVETMLGSIYPNPVSTEATISFSLDQSQKVSIKIFDLSGRIVFSLSDKFFENGLNEIIWNATDVPGGVYFLRMDAQDYSSIQKITVIK